MRRDVISWRRNAQYNSMATNLNIAIGSGNVGAVGIRLRGAQGSGIEDVTVHASVVSLPAPLSLSALQRREHSMRCAGCVLLMCSYSQHAVVHARGDGLAGVVGGCGSGGAHHGLRVIGGRYGLDLRQSQPTGSVSGATLEGQRCAGIIYVSVFAFRFVWSFATHPL